MNLAGLAMLGLAMLTTSCSEEVTTSDLTLDAHKTASVKVFFYADTDLSTVGLETAPEGTQVVVKADYDSFNPNATGERVSTATVNAEGYAMLSLPVSSDGTTYKVQAVDFEFDQKQPVGSKNATISKIFKAAEKEIALSASDVKIEEVTYAPENKDDFVQMVDIDIYLRGDFNQVSPELDRLPSGVSITLIGASGWSTAASFTDATIEGEAYSKASVSVATGETIKIIEFAYNKTLADGATKSYIYSATLAEYAAGDQGKGYRYTLSDKLNVPN